MPNRSSAQRPSSEGLFARRDGTHQCSIRKKAGPDQARRSVSFAPGGTASGGIGVSAVRLAASASDPVHRSAASVDGRSMGCSPPQATDSRANPWCHHSRRRESVAHRGLHLAAVPSARLARRPSDARPVSSPACPLTRITNAPITLRSNCWAESVVAETAEILGSSSAPPTGHSWTSGTATLRCTHSTCLDSGTSAR
jgi:hypothetical protein